MPRKPKIGKLDLYGVVDTAESDPATGEQGELFYNTLAGVLKIWLTDAWVAIGSGASDISGELDNLLLMTNDHMLLMSGSEDVLLLQ